jgi:hypothetical protein
MTARAAPGAPILLALLLGSSAAGADWAPFAETTTILIVTDDADGQLRETKVWIVVLGDAGYVRTNDSRWLANIQRGSSVEVRTSAAVLHVAATEVADAETKGQVEAAFKEKYGTVQRVMSFFRIREPTVLRLEGRPTQ